MPTHSLVIGGTGMLRGASKHLLKDFDIVSVIARNKDGFDTLADEAGKLSIKLNRIEVDYTHYHDLTNSVMKIVKDYGEISLVLSWIHRTAPVAPLIIAKIVNHTNSKCDYYEVLGSSDAEPDDTGAERKEEFGIFDNINYHKIILGFVVENDASRWLTNEEINKGVIDAITGNHQEYIVGSIEPWNKKP